MVPARSSTVNFALRSLKRKYRPICTRKQSARGQATKYSGHFMYGWAPSTYPLPLPGLMPRHTAGSALCRTPIPPTLPMSSGTHPVAVRPVVQAHGHLVQSLVHAVQAVPHLGDGSLGGRGDALGRGIDGPPCAVPCFHYHSGKLLETGHGDRPQGAARCRGSGLELACLTAQGQRVPTQTLGALHVTPCQR